MEPSTSAGRGHEGRTARNALFEQLPPEEQLLFLDVLTRELENHGDEDAAWDAAWRAVEDPFVSGLADSGRPRVGPGRSGAPAGELREPDFPNIRERRRFDLEMHVRRAREAGIPLHEALQHADEDVNDPGRTEADAQLQVARPDEEFLRRHPSSGGPERP